MTKIFKDIREKTDMVFSMRCCLSEVNEWQKYLGGKRVSLPHIIRDILNREVELKKLEMKE